MNESCCTIRTDFPRPAKELIEKFRGVPVSNLVDAMFGEFSLPSGLRPVNQVPLLGPAFTVQCPPGDNLMFHKSLDMVQPGDIIVIDAGGYTERGIVGELMTSFTRLHLSRTAPAPSMNRLPSAIRWSGPGTSSAGIRTASPSSRR